MESDTAGFQRDPCVNKILSHVAYEISDDCKRDVQDGGKPSKLPVTLLKPTWKLCVTPVGRPILMGVSSSSLGSLKTTDFLAFNFHFNGISWLQIERKQEKIDEKTTIIINENK